MFFCGFLLHVLKTCLSLNKSNAKTYIMKKSLFVYIAIFTAANFLAFAVLNFAKAFTSFTGA